MYEMQKTEEIIDKALDIYMQIENEKAEKELAQSQLENIEFSKEHKRKMKKIFREYRRMIKNRKKE